MMGGVPISELEDDIAKIVWDLTATATINQSIFFAEHVIDAFMKLGRVQSRGVKSANFAVLRSAVMPSILFEVAFISNKGEEKLLRNKKFINKTVDALYDSIKKFNVTLNQYVMKK